MERKHILYYKYDCPHCLRLLQMIQNDNRMHEFELLEVYGAKKLGILDPRVKRVPTILPNNMECILVGNSVFNWYVITKQYSQQSNNYTVLDKVDIDGNEKINPILAEAKFNKKVKNPLYNGLITTETKSISDSYTFIKDDDEKLLQKKMVYIKKDKIDDEALITPQGKEKILDENLTKKELEVLKNRREETKEIIQNRLNEKYEF